MLGEAGMVPVDPVEHRPQCPRDVLRATRRAPTQDCPRGGPIAALCASTSSSRHAMMTTVSCKRTAGASSPTTRWSRLPARRRKGRARRIEEVGCRAASGAG